MKKNKATQKSSHKVNQLNNTSITAQQARILAQLQFVGSLGLTTIFIRDELNCLHPPGRIRELREQGYIIQTLWTTTDDHCGRRHRVARYVLVCSQRSAA